MTVTLARCNLARCDTMRCDYVIAETQDELFDGPAWASGGIPNGYAGQWIVDTTGATGGTFDLEIDGSTYTFDWDVTAAEMEAELSGITVTGRPGQWILTMTTDVDGLIEIDTGSLTGSPTGVVIPTRTGGGDTSETPEIPVTAGGDAEDVTVTASATQIYTMELRDADDDLVDTIDNWSRGKMRLALDEAGQLQFRVPGNDAIVDDIIAPNRIVVRDRWGFAVDTFDPIERRLTRPGGDDYHLDVVGLSVMARLQKEVVTSYHEERSGAAHVAALLGMQQMSPPISVGTICPQVALSSVRLDVQDTTILAALKALQDSLPKENAGHFYVDARGRLQWPVTVGDQSGTTLSVGRHIQGITARYNYQDMVNRLYFYGAGQDPANRLTLLSLDDEGEPVHDQLYWQDDDSVTAYGVQPGIKVDRRYRKVTSLLSAAQRIVQEFKDPHVTIEMQVIDLAKSINLSDYPDLYVGSTYRVSDPHQGIDTEVQVKILTPDLDNPLRCGVELNNRTRDIGDLIARLAIQLGAIDVDVNDDGSRYPTIARGYTTENDPDYPDLEHKATDLLVSGGELYMHDGTEFRQLGATSGGVAPAIYVAATFGALPSGVVIHSLGFVTGEATWYGRNTANNAWLAISRWADVS